MGRYAIFDFDGTLTVADSLPRFIAHVFGWRKALWAFCKVVPEILLMKIGLKDNGEVKQRLFASLFSGMDISTFDAKCRSFAATHPQLLRPAAIECINGHIESGDKIYVVSASPRSWVEPFFSAYPVVVIGTEIEVKNGVLTGRFESANCYGAEKVRRLKKTVPTITSAEVVAYGDSRGDKEMLEFASESHYKPFRGKNGNHNDC